MEKSNLSPINGPAVSDEGYALALSRIDAVMGCTEDSPEEAELILWAEIADAYERRTLDEPPSQPECPVDRDQGGACVPP